MRCAPKVQLITGVSAISVNQDRSHQLAGSPFPRGANWEGKGVNLSLFSEASEAVELCLFDASGGGERRIRIRERTSGAWHIYVSEAGPGQLYGYRALTVESEAVRRNRLVSLAARSFVVLSHER